MTMVAELNLPGPLWLVGCGNMAGAMLRRWLDAGADPRRFLVIRPSGAPVARGVEVVKRIPDGPPPAIVMLGVKPQKLDEVAPGLAAALGPDTLLVSILAGVELATLRARFPAPRAIVRAMPNTPVALGKGVVALCSDDLDAAARQAVDALMAPLGHSEWFDDEELFVLAGHLTGAGPAFAYRFIDAMAAAAAQLGLPAEQALRLAIRMVEGAGALAAAADEAPAELARRVASPGGTTEAGLLVLDSEDALAGLILRTLEASRRRGRELAAATRGD
jgi:pyrroline-5-carboxylate reductase